MGAVIAPSILSADFSRLGADVKDAEAGGAALIHVDVMDGHFVPNITIGPAVTRAVRRITQLPIDVHLMIEEPARYIEAFAEAGADMISVHVEADRHLERTVRAIQALGPKAGVVLNPATSLDTLEEILPAADYVLLMSVNPGFGGQTLIPSVLGKIRRLRAWIDREGWSTRIEIDGGVTLENIENVAATGVDMIVAGSAVSGEAMRGAPPPPSCGPPPPWPNRGAVPETTARAGRTGTTLTRVRYPETDRMGVAHHTHYFVWFELGRTELMREAGCAYGALEDGDGVFFPVIEAQAAFKESARYDEEVEIQTRLTAVGGVRVRFDYEIRRAVDRRLLAAGYTVHASCGRDGRPMRLPESLREKLLPGGDGR